ncbi:MAG TPA: urea ABC transporter permease subunit UrtB [Alphaproteobacteria bacterium]|nr:urea ABC transporter permease subunit UrtB [Alphaproteobacteria bacterium]
MTDAINQLFTGLSIASILLLISLGLAIIYGTMGVINLAHGEFVMLGAYSVWFLQKFLGIGLIAGLVFVFIIVGAIGWFVERTIIRHLYHRPLDTILATWGIGVILQQAVRLGAGAELRYVKMPDSLTQAIPIFGVDQSAYRIFILLLTIALLVATYYLIFRTQFGMRLRAVTQNPEIAKCFGINTARVYSMTFAYGAGLAGIAGALVAPLKSVAPDMGTNFVVDAFMVVVVGGVQSLLGTVASAAVLGQVSGVIAFLANDTLAKALVFFGVVILIRFWPQGLFAMKMRRG